MSASAFDEIYTIFAKDPFDKITSKVLCQLFKDHKKLKVTNKMLESMREIKRPEIMQTLQESFSFQDQRN